VTARAVILMLTLTLLLFEDDLLAHRRTSRAIVRKVFTVASLPLLAAFVLVLIRRWRQFQ
jgi:hypothetical protein